jgi:dTDP-glucose 4,6-dehydratase
MGSTLVTGGCGFIGSNYVRLLLGGEETGKVVNLDCLSYAGNPANLEDLSKDERYIFIEGDICDGDKVRGILGEHDVERSCILPLNHMSIARSKAREPSWKPM